MLCNVQYVIKAKQLMFFLSKGRRSFHAGLKLKYYTKEGQIATLHGDIAVMRRCFEEAAKSFVSTGQRERKKQGNLLMS
jgi:hypothetical protein